MSLGKYAAAPGIDPEITNSLVHPPVAISRPPAEDFPGQGAGTPCSLPAIRYSRVTGDAARP